MPAFFLTISIPDNIPTPRYRLFQNTDRGEVIGLEYIDYQDSIESETDPGWWYTFHSTEVGVFTAHEDDITLADY